MKPLRRRRTLGISVLILLVSLAALIGYFRGQAGRAQVLYSGYVERPTYRLAFERPGKLLKLWVDEGDFVRAGDTLALLDTLDLALKRRTLEAQRQALQAQREGLAARLRHLRDEKQRLETLRGEAVPESRLRELETQEAQLQANLDALEAQLRGLSTQIAEVALALQRSVLTAPRDGLILERHFREQEIVGAGMPVFTLALWDSADVIFFVGEEDLPDLAPGMPVWARLDADPERWYPGQIRWIASEAEFTPKFVLTRRERQSLVFRVRARFPDPEGRFKTGLPVDVRLGGGS